MENKNLSTFVDYSVKGEQRDVKLKEKGWYELYMGSGYYVKVQVVKIRVRDGIISVYFRKISGKPKLFGLLRNWQYECMALPLFKEAMIELSSVPSISLSGKSHEKTN